MEIHNILVPTDFSADAESVLQQALVLVQLGGSLYSVLSTRSRAKTMRSPAPNWRGICGAQH